MGQCAEREGAGGRREGSGESARERSGGRRRRVEDVKQRNEFGMLPEGRAGGEAAAEEERRRAWWHLVVVRTEMAENGGERVIRVCVGWLPVGCRVFLFLYFLKKIYRNIFLVLGFTVLYPYRPAGGGRGPTARLRGGRTPAGR